MLTFIGITLVVIGIATFILKKVYTNNPKFNIPNSKRSFQIIVMGVFIAILNGMFFYADAGTAYAVQYVTGGDKMITTQGLKLKWWGRIIPLSYETSIKDIIVVSKPSGLLSVPGRGPDKQECLAYHLEPHYSELKIVHRLDMDTSGLMVLARSAEVHRLLSRQFQERQTEKTYHAICSGKPSLQSGYINLPMRCDWEKRPLQMIDFKQGKGAQTYWKVLQQYQNSFLVELTPITGRSHQLRLHMKSLGHPILGDNLYADPYSLTQAARLMLHAKTLSFTHPINNQKMDFDCLSEF